MHLGGQQPVPQSQHLPVSSPVLSRAAQTSTTAHQNWALTPPSSSQGSDVSILNTETQTSIISTARTEPPAHYGQEMLYGTTSTCNLGCFPLPVPLPLLLRYLLGLTTARRRYGSPSPLSALQPPGPAGCPGRPDRPGGAPLTVTPYLRAMPCSVSPALSRCST